MWTTPASRSARWFRWRCRCSSSPWRRRTCPASRCSPPSATGRARAADRHDRRFHPGSPRRSAATGQPQLDHRRSCAGEDASPDPARRWIAAASNGAACVVFGLLAGGVAHFVAGSPILVEAVAGLALLNAFGGALYGALADASEREAALATFLVTASGVSFFGVGGAFWGLVVGAASSSSIARAISARRQAGAKAL